jgi:[ribosomal protein S18]-alanine N-acetyltransferase
MNANPFIEAAPPDSIAQIMPVMAEAFDPAHGEAWTASQCAGVLSLPGSFLLIARHQDMVTGFALLRYVLDEAELLLLAVTPAEQRNGIGSALLGQAASFLRQNSVRRLHVEVRDDNLALRFYTKSGFAKVGRRRDYYRGRAGKRTDAVTLSLLLR